MYRLIGCGISFSLSFFLPSTLWFLPRKQHPNRITQPPDKPPLGQTAWRKPPLTQERKVAILQQPSATLCHLSGLTIHVCQVYLHHFFGIAPHVKAVLT